MFGWIMSIIAGAAMSLQGVINTRLSEKIGVRIKRFCPGHRIDIGDYRHVDYG